jgi:hypothetical protein
MRQVFSSPRLENIDRVEALLSEIGVETYVSNRDKLRRDRVRNFSYTARSDSSTWPAVWVKQAEDLPRARALLREAGVMGSTRPDVATQYQLRPRVEHEAPRAASHVRRVLLVLVAISALYFFGFKAMQAPQRQTVLPAKPQPPVAAETLPVEPVEPTIYVIDGSDDGGR